MNPATVQNNQIERELRREREKRRAVVDTHLRRLLRNGCLSTSEADAKRLRGAARKAGYEAKIDFDQDGWLVKIVRPPEERDRRSGESAYFAVDGEVLRRDELDGKVGLTSEENDLLMGLDRLGRTVIVRDGGVGASVLRVT